jgi:hypothetical protein
MTKNDLNIDNSEVFYFHDILDVCAGRILRGPTPPLVINPEGRRPKPFAAHSLPPPSVKPPAGTIPEKGVINPRSGEFYPGTIGGVVNPQTGEVLPKVEGGYINPKTGEFLPAQKWP